MLRPGIPMPLRIRRAASPIVCALAFTLQACTRVQPPPVAAAGPPPRPGPFIAESGHSPPFARMSYAGFSRAEAIAIAKQEWRLFGQSVFDDPPHTGAD